MISGLIKWIITTIILNPPVFVGLGIATYAMMTYPFGTLILVVQLPIIYEVLAGVSFVYACLFKHVHYPNSKRIDWLTTMKGSIGIFFTVIFASICGMVIIYSLDYINLTAISNYMKDK